MSVAFDFNEVPGPSADEIKAHEGEGALTYGTGAQQSPEYIAGLEIAGLHTVEIWEHNVDSILGGYEYGVAECQSWEASHPAGKLVYLACDLNDGALAGRDPSPFVHGWSDTTRESDVGTYGGDDALNKVRAASIAKATRWWGVVNWIEGGGPNNAQSNIDFWTNWGAHLVQLIGSPIANTDQNLILKPNWWSLGTTPAAAAHKEQQNMIVIFPTPFTTSIAWLMFGDRKVKEWVDAGPSDEVFGIPKAAAAWNERDGFHYEYHHLDAEGAVNLIALQATAGVPATPAPLPTSGLTQAQIEAALRNVLHGA